MDMHQHSDMHQHTDVHQHTGGHATVSWAAAAQATLHCLTGCAIGEVLGMIIGTALGWGDTATIALAVALAFFFGYALTITPVLRSGLSFGAAVKVALVADTVSATSATRIARRRPRPDRSTPRTVSA